ncbi:MAG: sigma-54-dependent transcriptional regulator [Nitrospirota bacterium]
MRKLLIVEDHDSLRHGIAEAFQRSGHRVTEAPDAETAIRLIGEEFFGVVITDMSLPGKNGLDVLKTAKAINPLTTVIVMTAHGTVDNAVEAMRLCCDDYIQKPFQLEELELKVSKLFEHQAVRQELDDLRGRVGSDHQLVGTSAALKHLLAIIEKVARGNSTVLIEGETGTGKELIANAIHAAGPRNGRSLVKVNCAALPEPLLESELFGHERGAFTGAERQRIGRFELANGGTLFLDEIGDMSLPTQAKLLRVMQEQAFERVGGEKTITVDVRIIAATNKHLETEARARRFREDLFYRLNVVTLTVPPLRDRAEDIPLLARHFLERYACELGKPAAAIEPAAYQELERYPWPGNIRELENTIERAVLMAEGDTLRVRDLGLGSPERRAVDERSVTEKVPIPAAHALGSIAGTSARSQRLDDVEKHAILDALARSNWVQKDAALILGVSPRVLNYKIKSHGITHPSWLKHRPRDGDAA